MCANVLAGDVRNESAISVLVVVEDKGSLLALIVRPKTLAAQKQTKFQRHIKTRQPG